MPTSVNEAITLMKPVNTGNAACVPLAVDGTVYGVAHAHDEGEATTLIAAVLSTDTESFAHFAAVALRNLRTKIK